MLRSSKGMNKKIVIHKRSIGASYPPFIIAEMSGNHKQSIDRALDIVDAAADSGAHAIKLQTYTADTMTIRHESDDFKINDPNSLWNGYHLHDLYHDAHTPWEWHEALFKRAKEKGISIFSSPFDRTAVDFLETLDCPAYKIASFENTDIALIRYAASTGKPIIVSTGMASIADIALVVETVKATGNKNLILLKCTSAYPATPADANLATIPHMRESTDCMVGLSDHTLGVGVSIASVMLGAPVIEKHFTLSREEGGVDAAFSLEPSELKTLVDESRAAWESRGQVHYSGTDSEQNSKQFKRSLYVVEDITAGETFTPQNVRSIRPGFGVSPKYYDRVMESVAKCDISRGTPLSRDMF